MTNITFKNEMIMNMNNMKNEGPLEFPTHKLEEISKGKKEMKVKKEMKGKKEKKEESGDRFSLRPPSGSGAEGVEKCSVCCEAYSSTIRKKIECPKCEYKCCKKCMELYLLNSIKNTANCMNCNLEFSSTFLFEKTSKIFGRDKYIEKQAIQVLNEQKTLLPSTLILLNKKKENLKRRNEIKKELLELKERTAALYIEFEFLKHGNLEMDIENDEKCNRHCPVNECKGYLSSAWKCGICDIYVCHECGNVKGKRTDEDHVCNEDDKKTIIMMKKDTKPCPGCSKYIYKIEGCDQMFCVGCHTVFSWNSGKKLNGVKCHNPHYYAYLRDTNGGVAPRVEGDNPCAANEELQEWWYLRIKFITVISDRHVLAKLEQIHRSIHHNDDFCFRQVNSKLSEEYKNKVYTSYREKYLESSPSSEYTESNWISNIKSELKMMEKCKQSKMVYDLFKIVAIDIFVKMYKNFKDVELTYMNEFENIRKYSNIQLAEIYKNYGTKVYMYNDKYILE